MADLEKAVDKQPKEQTLGTVQLRHYRTNKVILVPTPSNDPNDPLNWSSPKKYHVLALVCAGIFTVNFISVAPSVALQEITTDFFGDTNLASSLSKTSYLQTTCSLMIGVGNLVWIPLAIKYGRRPVYFFAFSLFLATTIWCGAAQSFSSQLVARLLLGTAAAAPEIVAPLTLTDVFFLHQRGSIMVIYTCCLACGSGMGVVLGGLIMIHEDWRAIYWLSTALVGVVTLLVVFSFPETHYKRQNVLLEACEQSEKPVSDGVAQEESIEEVRATAIPPKKTYIQELKVFSTTYTSESLLLLMYRPLVALALPAVLWATLINSITIGLMVVLSADFSTSFSNVYGFQPWQSGLTFIAGIIGALVGILCGGYLTDWVANIFTVRNGGVRTPEMRLPALVLSLISSPLSCLLYGFGFGKQLPWIVPVIGIALVNFTIVQANNIALLYILDSYRPIAGEVIVTQSVFKAIFGFLLSFYTKTWILESGYVTVFGVLAGISAGIFLGMIPFFFWGDRIRRATWHWGFIKNTLHWDSDREVGE
ncbi:hypothetical protein DTO212C5_2716 [Paecilomyces variotii]|nr:hypothetical protein DTO212C5_2716 [Paecilomyces variotii]